MSKYICGAVVDIGVERESQEDYVQYREFGDNLFCVVADGAGSQKGFPQPAVIAVSDILETLTEIYEENEELFLQNPEFFIKRAMLSANRVLGGFKMGNEERYYGYAASVTCCLFCQDGIFYMGHTGNTRLYILRNSALTQITRDQTKAAELLNEGKIDLEGLEWKHVFIIDCVEGVCPSPKAETAEELEEERRLFYVAMTRAKEHLYLCYYKAEEGKTVVASPYIM